MTKGTEILASQGLESWSVISENTKQLLSQVPWIREKVRTQDKDPQALQGAGVWSTSPKLAPAEEGDAGSINLEDDVPEFSLRRNNNNTPANRPIGDVLSEVRQAVKSRKYDRQNERAATYPGPTIGDKDPFSVMYEPSSSSPQRTILPSSLNPSPETTFSSKASSLGPKGQLHQKSHNSKTRLSQISLSHRHGSRDSTGSYEFQLFPAEIVTESNKEEIRRKIPKSIRDLCTFKDGYWWYRGDPTVLSGDIEDDKSRGGQGRPENSSKQSHPVIQRGSLTIAGRPVVVSRRFSKQSDKNEAWTCDPKDDIMMTDVPIPPVKDGETIVIPLDSISAPTEFTYTNEDPYSKSIDPRNYTEEDLMVIAKIVLPYEFCLWLNGTLQVMLKKKESRKGKKTFPRQIGGLQVTFSNGFASNTETETHRSRIFKLSSNSTSSLRSHDSSSSKHGSREPRSSHATNKTSSTREPARRHLSSTDNKKIPYTQLPPSGDARVEQTRDQKVTIGPSNPPENHWTTQNGNANGTTVPLKISSSMNGRADITASVETGAAIPESSIRDHEPCEVLIGEKPELGISCYVGVKIHDGKSVKITVPTSVALEAACKARKASGIMNRTKMRLHGEKDVDVRGLGVWMKAEPQTKIGTITRCFDYDDGNLLKKESRHPDDFLYDICLVEGITADSFAKITSPTQQWWTKANKLEPSQIKPDTLLHIVCPEHHLHDPAKSIGGRQLKNFAYDLTPGDPNAIQQAIRVVPRLIKSPGYSKFGSDQAPSKIVLQTSTLYRFPGSISSWNEYRGAAVVQVGDKNKWLSVVGLHSFEYLGAGTGVSEMEMKSMESGIKAGTLTIWGCRHLPKELTAMELIV